MRILCVSTLRNEGPFVVDWLAHYRAAGVSDFLIYTNDCDDGTDVLLDIIAQEGWLVRRSNSAPATDSVQWQALRAAWKTPQRKAADWALVCDADEFVNIHAGDGTFGSLIKALPTDAEAVALPWRLYGHNGQARLSEAPVPEVFTACAPRDATFPLALSLFKTLFRLDGPFRGFGVHRPLQKANAVPVWVDGAGEPLPEAFGSAQKRLSLLGFPSGRSLAEMNHYAVRSAESFLIKRDRGLPNRKTREVDLAYWVERCFGAEENRSIARMTERAAKERARLLARPEVAALHSAAIVWHRERFAELMCSETGYRLFTQCLLAGHSNVLSQRTAVELYGAFQRMARRSSQADADEGP